MLGDAAGLFLADVGLADGVQQSGLAVVDVTHDGHHRRTGLEVLLATLVLAVGEVEGLEQLAVLVLGGHDLNDVVHLAAEQLEGLVADGLRRGHHLAEVEQRLHQRGRVGVDLLGEVGQRRAAGQPDGLAVAVRQPHAADDRRLHRVVFLALLPLRLAATLRRAAGTTERACGSAALTWPSAATAAAGATAIAGTRRGTATATAAGTAGATDRGSYRRRRLHRRDDHRCLHRDHGRRGRAGRRRGRAGGRRDAVRDRARRHRDAAAYCPATCRAAGHPDGVPADAESAGQPAAPRRTGCCRRAGYARRASAQWARGRASDQALRRGREPGGSAWLPQAGPLLPPREARPPVPRVPRVRRAWGRAPSRGRPLSPRPWPASRCRRP